MDFNTWLSVIGIILVVYICLYSVTDRICRCIEKRYEGKKEK